MSSPSSQGTPPPSTASSAEGCVMDAQSFCQTPESGLAAGNPELDHSQLAAEKHPKGRRKRTAAKDKSILEAAYNANPKPDKVARLDLVKRVSLNEKEVQIWFQNRRQNDRRKSRPLSPQEIAALRSGGMQLLSSDPITSSSQVGDCTSPLAEAGPFSMPKEDESLAPALGVETSPSIGASQVEPRVVGEPLAGATEPRSLATQESPLGAHGPLQFFSSSIADSSDRCYPTTCSSTPALNRTSDLLRPQLLSASSPPTTSVCSNLSTPQSQVRLSLSLEGKAELVSQQSPRGPSPLELSSPLPHVSHDRPRAFQRSKSAIVNVTLPPISALTDGLPPSLRRGRSRDAQAWEQCCDSDKRDELTTQAENESSGSAVAAISLLRSTSGILQPNSTKRNAPPLKWKSQPDKKPRLARTASSNAVMQQSENRVPIISPTLKSAKVSTISQSPSGDSDKENRSPEGENTSSRSPPSQPFRRFLGTNFPRSTNMRRHGHVVRQPHAPWLLASSRAITMPAASLRDVIDDDLEIFEDAGSKLPPRASDEVERFMRGEVSPSKKGDMDCIAGLLSLSQGNWR